MSRKVVPPRIILLLTGLALVLFLTVAVILVVGAGGILLFQTLTQGT